MNPRKFPLALILPAWLTGLCVGVMLLFTIGPQMQCAADPTCALAGERWWQTPLIFGVAFGPGIAATVAWWRSRHRAG